MWTVAFTADAENDLASLDKTIAQRVLRRIRWLVENFEHIQPESLTGQWQGVYKLRVGDYRALYTFDRDAEQIVFHVIKHRREVYKFR